MRLTWKGDMKVHKDTLHSDKHMEGINSRTLYNRTNSASHPGRGRLAKETQDRNLQEIVAL